MSRSSDKKKKPLQHLVGGGMAGLVESSICHPLDTIKTRMQLRRQTHALHPAASLPANPLAASPLEARLDAGGVYGKALGSLREVDGKLGHATRSSSTISFPCHPRAPAATAATTAANSAASSAASAANAAANAASNAASNAANAVKSAVQSLHDVTYDRRIPPAQTMQTAPTAPPVQTVQTAQTALGPLSTARRIVEREGPKALYKGLTAVYTGIVPKMAIRFVSFEHYRDLLARHAAPSAQAPPPAVTFCAGLLAGLTEAVLIVTPAEVCKIRMQSQHNSLLDPRQAHHAKYRNVAQTAVIIVREEGFSALYKGVVPTMLRQGCNQAVNFTVYNWSKKIVINYNNRNNHTNHNHAHAQLHHWQSLCLGGLSGGMGPLVNNPLDVVKTRMQKQVIQAGQEPKYKSLFQSCVLIAKEEGTAALWKGITPRLMRIMPGQAITFMTYEAVTARMERYGWFS